MPLMGCSLFSNSHFQMGVTVMGFAEPFGLYLKRCKLNIVVIRILVDACVFSVLSVALKAKL